MVPESQNTKRYRPAHITRIISIYEEEVTERMDLPLR